MYSIVLEFSVLNKDFKFELNQGNNGNIQIIPQNKTPFSIIINGFETEYSADNFIEKLPKSKILIPSDRQCITKRIDVGDSKKYYANVHNTDELNEYRIIVDNFETVEDAKGFISKIETGFILYLLLEKNNFSYHCCFDNEKIQELPQYVLNGDPFICETPKIDNVITVKGGKIKGVIQESSERLIDCIQKASGEIKDKKLKLALEIYRSSFYEDLPNAKFFTLMNILEVLSENHKKTKVVLELLDKWKEEIDRIIKDTKNKEDEDCLEREKGTMMFQDKDGITKGICNLVSSVYGKNMNKKVSKLYSVRSGLTHNGEFEGEDKKKRTEVFQELHELQKIVNDVLIFRVSKELGKSLESLMSASQM